MQPVIVRSADPLSVRRRVLGGSFWALIGVVLRAAIGFVSVPLTLTYLGNDRLGLWRVGVSTLSFATFLRAGLIPHLKTHMAVAFAEHDEQRFNEYSSTSILLAGVFVLAGIVGAALAPLIDWNSLFKVQDSRAQGESLPLMMVLSVLTMSQFATVFVEALFDAQLQGSKPRFYGILGSIAGLALLLLGIKLRVALPVLAALTATPWVLCTFPLIWELYWHRPETILPRRSSASRVLREIARPSITCMLIQLACVFVSFAPNLLVARYGSLADVTTFSLCYQLATYPLLALAGLMPIFWPAFTVLWSRGESSRLRRWMTLALSVTVGALLAFTLLMGIGGDWLLRIWTRGQVSPTGLLLILLGVFAVLQGCNHWITTFLWSTSDHAMLLASYAMTAAVLLVVGAPLTNRWGLNGLAFALIVALLIGGILLPLRHFYVRIGQGVHDKHAKSGILAEEDSTAP